MFFQMLSLRLKRIMRLKYRRVIVISHHKALHSLHNKALQRRHQLLNPVSPIFALADQNITCAAEASRKADNVLASRQHHSPWRLTGLPAVLPCASREARPFSMRLYWRRYSQTAKQQFRPRCCAVQDKEEKSVVPDYTA